MNRDLFRGKILEKQTLQNFFANRKRIKAAVLTIFALVVVAGGLYSWMYQVVPERIAKSALHEIESGNYAAALVLYNKLDEKSGDNEIVKSQVEEARSLLIAQENFLRAQIAAEHEKWFTAYVLLEASEGIFNPVFLYNEEAMYLHKKAKEEVVFLEEQANTKIIDLQQTIVVKESSRKQVEKQNQQIKTELRRATIQKEETENALEFKKKELKESEDRLAKEHELAEAFAREAELERLQKFLNEMSVYVEMLKRGDEYLVSSIMEIEQKRDIAALLSITQGRVLFNEVHAKSIELRSDRTPSEYKSQVDDLVKTAVFFVNSSKNLRNAVVYIEESQGSEFMSFFGQGRNLRNQANGQLGNIVQFIASN